MSGGSSSKEYRERRWYCHNCNYGPLSCRLDDWCPNCSHSRCGYCQEVVMTYRSGR
ncbi:uncharacterized protein B0H64DRAFT_438663 [Chaetomium fimeti]|uniref:Uncharacterized protein n=1 Tax=Chaetomium fimeti TaxID=1854472 RepID=A0AAE0HKZ6_9PEZI|nr:hypothetical protein B0H64DRAFT_438663 [Chaetomium fimeti]